MHRPRHIWLSFGLCLALAAATVGWLSLRALRAEKAELEARQQAVLEENVRLALWRMDSSLSVFLAQENARPFEAFLPPARPPVGMMARRTHGMPNPPQVRLYFQIGPNGDITSPAAQITRAPEATAVSGPGDHEGPPQSGSAIDRLNDLRKMTKYQALLAFLPRPTAGTGSIPLDSPVGMAMPFATNDAASGNFPGLRSANEFRNRSLVLNQNSILGNGLGNNTDDFGVPFRDWTAANRDVDRPLVGILAPVVLESELLLARRACHVGKDDEPLIQGAWLDWPLLRRELESQVVDLLPAVHLELHPPDSVNVDEARRLALLPIRVESGLLAVEKIAAETPVRLSLMAAWGALSLAAAAVATLLAGVVALSERRADFVSAVTHELRTPLTTFRLYAEMLSSGMVQDDRQRRQYLDTLRIEADRLTHLVENVLAYARLERGGLGNRVQAISGGQLLTTATQRLTDRATQSGFTMKVQSSTEAQAAMTLADPSAVEQILFNLVDNACKYAQGASERELTLQATAGEDSFVLRLSDCGPGISDEQRPRLFQPFRKSAFESARTAPGVGLGLSLSRRLARDMGGDLRLVARNGTGATFELSLRLASHAS